MKMKQAMSAALAGVLLGVTAGTAFAHGDGTTLMGTVTALAGDKITVRAMDGDLVEVPVDEATAVRQGDVAVTLKAISPGTRVVVELAPDADGAAKSIRLPAEATDAAPQAAGSEKGGKKAAPYGDAHGSGHEHHGGQPH